MEGARARDFRLAKRTAPVAATLASKLPALLPGSRAGALALLRGTEEV